MSQGPDGDDESESQTEAHDPTPMEVQLSTWGPSNDVHPNKSKENVQLLPQGQQRVKLTYGQTLAVLGQYDLKVLSGVITVYGVLLTPKSDTRRIVAPSTHPLPVIRCVSGDGAEVQFLSILREDESLKSMERVSPLFKGIWHCECGKYALDELGHSFTKVSTVQ
jgi:polynucleotide 5'-hydroxyl-kinase GRC3/NOL9